MKKNLGYLLFLFWSLNFSQSPNCVSDDSYLTNLDNWCWWLNGSASASTEEQRKNHWDKFILGTVKLPFPFDIDNQQGVPTALEPALNYTPEQGWVLFDRRIITNDHADRPLLKTASTPAANINQRPYFILYNKFTGTLKTFIFGNPVFGNVGSAKKLTITVRIVREKIPISGPQGILSIDSRPISLPVNTPNTNQETIQYLVNNPSTNQWLIIDTHIGYDPDLVNPGSLNGSPIHLEYTMQGLSEAEVKLNGNILTPDVNPPFISLLTSSLKTAAGAGALGFTGNIGAVVGGNIVKELYANFLNEKRDDGKKIDWAKALGEGFKDASDAKIWGKLPFVDLFSNSSATSTSFSKDSIIIKGTITSIVDNPVPVNIPLPGANLSEYPPTQRPYFFTKNTNQDIGLYSFKRNPIFYRRHFEYFGTEKVQKGATTWVDEKRSWILQSFKTEDIRELISINPNAGVKLEEVKVQLWYNYKDQDSRYTYLSPYPLYRRINKTVFSEWLEPDSLLQWERLYAAKSTNTKLNVNSFFVKPNLKIFLRFKSNSGKDFVFIRKVDVTLSDYTKELKNWIDSDGYISNIFMDESIIGTRYLSQVSKMPITWGITGMAADFFGKTLFRGGIETTLNGVFKVQYESVGDLKPTIDGITPTTLVNLGKVGNYTKWEFYVFGFQKKLTFSSGIQTGEYRNMSIIPLPIVPSILTPLLL